jgi:hypothetical protein
MARPRKRSRRYGTRRLLKQWRFKRDRSTIYDMLLSGDPEFDRLLRRAD